MIAIGSGQRLWLEDLGAGWLAGDGGAQGAGVCSTFLRIGAGAAQVTLRAAQLKILMLRAGRILRANWSVVQQLAGVLSKTKRRLEGAPLQEILAGVSW